VPKDGSDTKKRQTLKDFIQFIVTDGQNLAEQLEYARLPPALADQNQKLIADMRANGQPIQGTSSSASR
jgi:hypothetical protein